MLLDRLGLSEEPFQITPRPRAYFNADAHRRARKAISVAIEQGRPALALIGEVGGGKTTLLYRLAQDMLSSGGLWLAARTDNTRRLADLTLDDIVRTAARSAGIAGDLGSREQYLAALAMVLAERAERGTATVLPIDDADELEPETLSDLLTVIAPRTGQAPLADDNGRALLTVILAGTSDLIGSLRDAGIDPETGDPLETVMLAAWSPEDVRGFIRHSLDAVAYRGPELFSREAIERIIHYSRGLPLAVQRLCSSSLVLASMDSTVPVPMQFVEEAAVYCWLKEPSKPTPTPQPRAGDRPLGLPPRLPDRPSALADSAPPPLTPRGDGRSRPTSLDAMLGGSIADRIAEAMATSRTQPSPAIPERKSAPVGDAGPASAPAAAETRPLMRIEQPGQGLPSSPLPPTLTTSLSTGAVDGRRNWAMAAGLLLAAALAGSAVSWFLLGNDDQRATVARQTLPPAASGTPAAPTPASPAAVATTPPVVAPPPTPVPATPPTMVTPPPATVGVPTAGPPAAVNEPAAPTAPVVATAPVAEASAPATTTAPPPVFPPTTAAPTTPAAVATTPPVVAPVTPPASVAVGPAIDANRLIARGESLLRDADVASARLYFERAATTGSGRAALMMAMTYDPLQLQALGVRGVRPDAARALDWYGRAAARGDGEADRLASLLRGRLVRDAAAGDAEAARVLGLPVGR